MEIGNNGVAYKPIDGTGASMTESNKLDVNEIRRTRLRQLIDEEFDKKQKNLAKAIGRAPSAIARWLSEDAAWRRNIGATVARDIEKRLGKPEGWFDYLPSSDGKVFVSFAKSDKEVDGILRVLVRSLTSEEDTRAIIAAIVNDEDTRDIMRGVIHAPPILRKAIVAILQDYIPNQKSS